MEYNVPSHSLPSLLFTAALWQSNSCSLLHFTGNKKWVWSRANTIVNYNFTLTKDEVLTQGEIFSPEVLTIENKIARGTLDKTCYQKDLRNQSSSCSCFIVVSSANFCSNSLPQDCLGYTCTAPWVLSLGHLAACSTHGLWFPWTVTP
jgi:hypothetical protein